MKIYYIYWLGMFMIGPFTSLPACQEQQRYQLAWGAREEVTECWTVVDLRGSLARKQGKR